MFSHNVSMLFFYMYWCCFLWNVDCGCVLMLYFFVMTAMKYILKNALILLITSSIAMGGEKGTVLITGANRGLGLELVKHFVADDYTVIGTARKPEKATDLKATGATIIKLDVTSEKDIAAMRQTLKGRRIDILINNAGYFGPKLMTEKPDNIEKLTREEMTRCISVNTLGPLFVTQALLPNLRHSQNPKVINMSTRSAILNARPWGQPMGIGSVKLL